MIHPPFSRSACTWALLALSAPAWSQSPPPTSGPEPSLREVTVTGNPLDRPESTAPVHQLNLNARPQDARTTLGATLDGLPGVSSTYFGPNANRPVIRGLDGDRIRILSNSGTTLDASALSYDHAVPLDPLVAERLEVLRGPAALLYGGSATGGVVNVLDNRIPREPQEGVSGKADLGLASGNRERGAAALLEAGNGRTVLHVDAFERRTGDVRAPLDLPCEQGGVVTTARRLCNSASHSRGGAAGASVFFDQGFIGLSLDETRSRYGTVAEDEVTVGMHTSRAVLAGEWRSPGALIERLRGQWGRTDYRHTELEAGNPGTVFANRGNALRLEARHRAFGPVQGVVGLQVEGSDFSADGTEAFAPFSATRSRAVFVHEEVTTGWGLLSLGVRGESVRVTSLGNPDPSVTRFATGERRFSPGSVAVALSRPLATGWQATAHLARTRRAPKDYELFANGPHVATAAWETGDPSLGLETSTSLDLGLAWSSGPNQFRANIYHSRFGRFIGLLDTGASRGADGEVNPLDADGDGLADGSGEAVLPEQAYRGVRARFSGFEASGSVRLAGASAVDPQRRGGVLDLQWRLDRVQATHLDTGEPLPRIAPARAGATLVWSEGPLSARLGFDHVAAQRRVPIGSRPTAAYTLWQLGVNWRQQQPAASLTWYARVDNLTDRLAWSASSVLTTTAFPRAPLPGRSLKVGLQVVF